MNEVEQLKAKLKCLKRENDVLTQERDIKINSANSNL